MVVTCRTTADSITLPSAPSGLVSTSSPIGVSLDWNDNPTSETITSYKVYRGTNQGGPFTLLGSVQSSSYQDDTAVSGTVYWYRVSAVNSSGEGEYTDVEGTFASDSTAPGEVTITTGPTQVGATAVTMTWISPSDPDLAGEKVYAKQDSGAYVLASGSGLIVNEVFNHLTAEAGHDWTYKVTTVDSAGNESSGVVSSSITIPGSDTTAPASPTGLQAVGTSDGILLTWDRNVEFDLASYEVYQNGSVDLGSVSSTDPTSFLDSTTDVGVSTYYTLTASDGTGNTSDPSDPSNSTQRLEMTKNDLSPFIYSGKMVPCCVHARGVDYRHYVGTVVNNITTVNLNEKLDFLPLSNGTQITTDYAWNFVTNPAQSQGLFTKMKGFNAAHAYDNAGTYSVQLTRTDSAGKVDTFSANVSFAADTRTIIYCAPDGDNSSTNLGADPSKPVNASRAQAILNTTANCKIRLKNGTTFTSTGTIFTFSQPNQMLGGYQFPGSTSTVNPVLAYSGPGSGYRSLIVVKSTATDCVLQNFTVTRTYTPTSTQDVQDQGISIYSLGCLLRNIAFGKCASPITVDNVNIATRYLLVQGCTMDDDAGMSQYFCFFFGQDLVFLGNRVVNSTRQHDFRGSQYSRVLFAFNNLTNKDRSSIDPYDPAKTMLEAHEGTDFYCYQNTLTTDLSLALPTVSKQTGALGIGPLRDTNGHRDEFLKYVVLEGNTINSKLDIQSGLTDMVVKNNIINIPDSHVISYDGISGNDSAGLPYYIQVTRVYIYNNTLRNGGKTGSHISFADNLDSIEIINNHFLATTSLSTNPNSAICMDFKKGFGSNNLVQRNTFPGQDNIRISSIVEQTAVFNLRSQASGTNVKEATVVSSNYTPASNSIAATAARPKAGVFDDRTNKVRQPKALSWTCGAYQV